MLEAYITLASQLNFVLHVSDFR